MSAMTERDRTLQHDRPSPTVAIGRDDVDSAETPGDKTCSVFASRPVARAEDHADPVSTMPPRAQKRAGMVPVRSVSSSAGKAPRDSHASLSLIQPRLTAMTWIPLREPFMLDG